MCYNAHMKQIRFLFSVVICLLLLCVIPNAAAETEQAEDLTEQCSFDFASDAGMAYRMFKNRSYSQMFDAHASFSFTWEEAFSDARLCLQWFDLPEDICVLQYDADGALLVSETLPNLPETITPLLREARRAEVRIGEKQTRVWLCGVYGKGELPDPFHDWEELPERLDYLLIATHADDDVLFLGSIPPIYGAERGYVGTVAYVTDSGRERISEAEDGAWALGIRIRPLFFGFPDIERGAGKDRRERMTYEALLQQMVETYRRCRPLVVFAQDEKGEYGHWQHILSSKAARDAFALAADPTFDPESAERYGTWQVQKLYLHLYPENTIVTDDQMPLAFFDGQNAYEVARAAFKKHVTQQGSGYAVNRVEGFFMFPFNRFGMAEGVVPSGDDVFDGIDETLFAAYVPPTPEPTEAPTPEPTEPPTPEPTETPEISLTPRPTDAPTAVPTAEPDAEKPDESRLLLWGIGACAIICAALIVFALQRGKRNRSA